jgi:hypothetical protein
MKEELQARLVTLRQELENGQAQLQELELQETKLRETLLRIRGAIQVIEEQLAGQTAEQKITPKVKNNAIKSKT